MMLCMEFLSILYVEMVGLFFFGPLNIQEAVTAVFVCQQA